MFWGQFGLGMAVHVWDDGCREHLPRSSGTAAGGDITAHPRQVVALAGLRSCAIGHRRLALVTGWMRCSIPNVHCLCHD